jgi:uncharacterized glyoxalase superfamily protein PhnB
MAKTSADEFAYRGRGPLRESVVDRFGVEWMITAP